MADNAAQQIRKILISGAGIAGPTLAWWLAHYGFEPTLVECAPTLRRGGYIVDFWGTGFEVAQRMGLESELRELGYDVAEVRIVNAQGKRCGGFSADVFRDATEGKYTSIARGDLSGAIYRRIQGRVETLFGDSVRSIAQDDAGVLVQFEQAPERRFDLVVAADGLHSRVRELTFGDQSRFEKPLGYTVAAFESRGYRPRDEDVYIGYGRPGQQIARFSMRDDRSMFLFTFAHDLTTANGLPDTAEVKRILHSQFDDGGWECAQILAAMDGVGEIYFDRVSQIHMPTWSQGRVGLLGDAASCPSLLAGEGSALAMTQAYVLAGELKAAAGDHRVAFAAYERRLREFIDTKQRDAVKFAGAFVPRTAFGLFARNQISRALAFRPVANYFIGRGLIDNFELPDYR
ncbi:MAG TPA: FAD-binding domain [Rudaea sp.]|nr:FAD-binding domain [Rudaea sp.]